MRPTRWLGLALILAFALRLSAPTVEALQPAFLSCDLLFAGGRVVDGTGAPWFRGDVCVNGDRIAAVGHLPNAAAKRRIDASRLVIAPGFIDMMEADVREALRHPLVSFCTDSGASAEDGVFSKQKSHPRAWGSAARILGHYVREEKLLTLEEAICDFTTAALSAPGWLRT